MEEQKVFLDSLVCWSVSADVKTKIDPSSTLFHYQGIIESSNQNPNSLIKVMLKPIQRYSTVDICSLFDNSNTGPIPIVTENTIESEKIEQQVLPILSEDWLLVENE